MLKYIKGKGSKEKNPSFQKQEVSAPIKGSNEESANKLPDLNKYRESKIVRIPGDLQSNNSFEKLQPEKFAISKANSRTLNRYNSEQLFKTIGNTSNKLPDLNKYRESKIVRIPGDLQSDNSFEKLQPEKFNITGANSKVLAKYDPIRVFRAGDPNSKSVRREAGTLQKDFALGQEILQRMGYTKIYRIENKLLEKPTTKESHFTFKV